jgi:hypothetical protein
MGSLTKYYLTTGLITLFFLLSCNSDKNSNHKERNISISKNLLPDTLSEIAITDSANHLVRVKGLFYKGRSGHLYLRTWYNKDVAGIDTLVDGEYFNGTIPQDIDPYTFNQFDLYAMDKRFAYFCQPTSGGLAISKIDNADITTFKAWGDPESIAADSKHVYIHGNLLKGIDPSKTQKIINKEGVITGLRCDNIDYPDSILYKLTY